MSVVVSFTDPATVVYESAHGRWFASEMNRGSLIAADQAPDPGAAIADLCKKHRSGSVTFVGSENGSARVLISAKGIVGSHERFHAPTESGWYVSDHFRNAVSRVAVADRHPSPIGLVEHYLFSATHGDRSYSHKVDRVTHGEVVTIDLGTGSISRRIVDRLTPPAERPDRAAAIDQLDRAMAIATDAGPNAGRKALLFSGGVDSALLQTYMDPETTAVTWVPDTPEFAGETEYARAAARNLGVEIVEVPVREADFKEQLGKATETMGLPPMHISTPFSTAIYEGPYDTFFTGEGADALFGVGMRLGQVSSWLTNPVAVSLLGRAMKVGPARLRHRLGQIYETAPRLAMAPGPRSYGVGNGGAMVADQVGEVLGMEVVLAALQAKLDYVDARVELEGQEGDHKTRNQEYRHWSFTLADPVVGERHRSQAIGKAYHTVYGAPPVVETALAVRPAERYVHRLRGKWMVKELLARQAPSYPIDQHKKPTHIPFDRFYASGPMSGFWDEYDVPEVFTGKARDDVVRGYRLTWPAVIYALWDARIGSNATLTPHPARVEVEIP